MKLLGRLACLHGHEEGLCDHNFVPFFSRVTFTAVKLSSIFSHWLGSAMACARHYFLPLIMPLKCTGLLGKRNHGSMRGQVFWGLQISLHYFISYLRVVSLCFGKSKEFSILSRPDLIDFDKLKKSNAHYNLQNAFNLAEQHLGLTKLLDPEGKNSCSFSTSPLFVGSFLVAGHSFVKAFCVKEQLDAADSPGDTARKERGECRMSPAEDWAAVAQEPLILCLFSPIWQDHWTGYVYIKLFQLEATFWSALRNTFCELEGEWCGFQPIVSNFFHRLSVSFSPCFHESVYAHAYWKARSQS